MWLNSGPGSLPGYRRRMGGGEYDDGASDISSTSGFSAYGYRSGTRLYREPASKSNRSIILNAVEFVVFPGEVNRDTRERVLDVIDRCDCPHFLLLFRWVILFNATGYLLICAIITQRSKVSIPRLVRLLPGHRRSLQNLRNGTEASHG